MKYINEKMVRQVGIDWPSLLETIDAATRLISSGEFCQPLKPYLRFNDPANRIIAMPAYAGGCVNTAGIKWIASFPGNLDKAIRRAHSIMILNHTETGIPLAIINTALISSIRTAAVSGYVLNKYLQANDGRTLRCGIIGFGPIGRMHLDMLLDCYGKSIGEVTIYDQAPVQEHIREYYDRHAGISIARDWQEAFEESDLLITCTVARERYIDRSPKKGGVYLNVSLRDYYPDFLNEIDLHVVDNWKEVCRENTDIERAALRFGLSRSDVLEMDGLLDLSNLVGLHDKSFMFNPMGMAVYDMAVGKHYFDRAVQQQLPIELED